MPYEDTRRRSGAFITFSVTVGSPCFMWMLLLALKCAKGNKNGINNELICQWCTPVAILVSIMCVVEKQILRKLHPLKPPDGIVLLIICYSNITFEYMPLTVTMTCLPYHRVYLPH